MNEDDTFVLAVKRERRDAVPADWIDVVRNTAGVTVLGDASPSRLQIRASADGISKIRDRLADYVHIEKVIPHFPS